MTKAEFRQLLVYLAQYRKWVRKRREEHVGDVYTDRDHIEYTISDRLAYYEDIAAHIEYHIKHSVDLTEEATHD